MKFINKFNRYPILLLGFKIFSYIFISSLFLLLCWWNFSLVLLLIISFYHVIVGICIIRSIYYYLIIFKTEYFILFKNLYRFIFCLLLITILIYSSVLYFNALLETPINYDEILINNKNFLSLSPIDFSNILNPSKELFLQEDLKFQKGYFELMSKVNRLTYVFNNYITDISYDASHKVMPDIDSGCGNDGDEIIVDEFHKLRCGIKKDATDLLKKLDKVSELESQIGVINKKYSVSKCEELHSTISSYKDIECKWLSTSNKNV